MWPSWFALLGVFFLHTAAFLLNDVQDHLRGVDRLSRRRGSQVIQKGWVSANAMKKWAVVNFALAIGFGVPAFLNAPLELAMVCAAAGICLLVLWSNRGARYGLSDLALALLFGPLLTCGIALASFGTTGWHDFILGAAFGSLTVWALQVRQLEYLFRSKPESFRTLLGFWSFDRVRSLILVGGILILISQPVIALLLAVPLRFFILLPVVSMPLILFLGRVRTAASPLSSNLIHADRWALGSHVAWAAWWILALGASWL
jgi:1,4-dihydroxy-2-naphthoate octaprenyltransferase